MLFEEKVREVERSLYVLHLPVRSEGVVYAAGCDRIPWKPSVDEAAGQQFIDAFYIEPADRRQLLTFTKCCLGDNLIEPSFSDLKPLSMEP